MQQYQVPQFINIEDRIIGPLTLKQFLYLVGAGAVGLLGWKFLYFPLFLILVVPIAVLFIALAFGKVDERPLPVVFTNGVNYFLRPRLYLWKKILEPPKVSGTKIVEPPSVLESLSRISGDKLNDLAWSLDIKERIAGRE